MDYQRIYNQIIERAKLEKRNKGNRIYYEAHHIIPICLDGKGSVKQWKSHSNIILLTAREHFICHRLLHLIYPNNKKLELAFCSMCFLKNDKQSRYTPSSRIVESAKIKMAELKSGEKGYWSGKHLYKSAVQQMIKTKTGVPIHSEEFKKRVGVRSKENTDRLNKFHTKESKKLMSDSQLKNYESNPSRKKKMSERLKNKKQNQIECPYCHKLGGHTMPRWHFENCKLKP